MGSSEAVNRRKTCTENTIATRKETKGQTMIYKKLHRKLKIEQHEPQYNRGELMFSIRVSSSSSTSGTHLITLATNTVIGHE